MAESTLSLTYTDLQTAVGQFLGWGRDSTLWTTDRTAVIDECIQEGYRRFLHPKTGYRWRFLRPTTTIATVASDYDQDLPDDFGGIHGTFSYSSSDSTSHVIEVVSEEQIRLMRQGVTSTTGKPRYAAIRPKATDPTGGQRFEVLWFPTPDAAYTLTYSIDENMDKLSSTNLYPLGGMKHSSTLRAICLAVAEETMDDNIGVKAQIADSLLAASIAIDAKDGPQTLGYNGDHSSSATGVRLSKNATVTYT